MKYGCCTRLLKINDEPEVFRGSLIKSCGYTYAEFPMFQLMELSDRQVRTLRDKMKDLGLAFESSNCFYPPSIRLTGPDVDMDRVLDYSARAFELSHSLGIRVIVFGSPAARLVPDGFPFEKAMEQMVEILTRMSEQCSPLGVDIAFEACNIYINNIIVNLHEAYRLCEQVNRPGIGIVADYYHLCIANEDMSIIETAGKYIHHVHFSNPAGTPFPIAAIWHTYEPFLQMLKKIGYNRCFTIEEHDCAAAERDYMDGFAVLMEFDHFFRQ